mmetsp:Transcript_23415/g.62884  ORF Transcript_23415/g.62884 Transcript_23415/m.62884 type:complete len:298 (+) Transcript_23415:1418-2311(+)
MHDGKQPGGILTKLRGGAVMLRCAAGCPCSLLKQRGKARPPAPHAAHPPRTAHSGSATAAGAARTRWHQRDQPADPPARASSFGEELPDEDQELLSYRRLALLGDKFEQHLRAAHRALRRHGDLRLHDVAVLVGARGRIGHRRGLRLHHPRRHLDLGAHVLGPIPHQVRVGRRGAECPPSSPPLECDLGRELERVDGFALAHARRGIAVQLCPSHCQLVTLDFLVAPHLAPHHQLAQPIRRPRCAIPLFPVVVVRIPLRLRGLRIGRRRLRLGGCHGVGSVQLLGRLAYTSVLVVNV